ncbi:c-type cytochrome [Flavobacterium sp.]|jgi:mono/diheme cytochrome c family protein|uniref:c-type cytochrome n=1 Tax=Flavobacterium sp. TaxID=239 RepID=UPI0037C16090
MKNKNPRQIVLKLAFIVVALFYASTGFAQHEAPMKAPKTAVKMKNPFPADEFSLERGKHSYQLDCIRCHGKDGNGDGIKSEKVSKEITDLGSDVIQKQTDGELFWKISEARRPMPLTDITNDQRWDIVNYIRTFKKK